MSEHDALVERVTAIMLDGCNDAIRLHKNGGYMYSVDRVRQWQELIDRMTWEAIDAVQGAGLEALLQNFRPRELKAYYSDDDGEWDVYITSFNPQNPPGSQSRLYKATAPTLLAAVEAALGEGDDAE